MYLSGNPKSQKSRKMIKYCKYIKIIVSTFVSYKSNIHIFVNDINVNLNVQCLHIINLYLFMSFSFLSCKIKAFIFNSLLFIL